MVQDNSLPILYPYSSRNFYRSHTRQSASSCQQQPSTFSHRRSSHSKRSYIRVKKKVLMKKVPLIYSSRYLMTLMTQKIGLGLKKEMPTVVPCILNQNNLASWMNIISCVAIVFNLSCYIISHLTFTNACDHII